MLLYVLDMFHILLSGDSLRDLWSVYTEWPKKMYTLFTHQYLWNKFK